MRAEVPIEGGYSTPRKICMYTDKVESVAEYVQKKEIITLQIRYIKHGKKCLKNTSRDLIFVGAILGITYALDFLFGKIPASIITWALIIGIIISHVWRMAPWHGAEHKVIEAYWQTGKSYSQVLKNFSPVSDRCGARLLPTVLLILCIAIGLSFFITSWIVLLLCILGMTLLTSRPSRLIGLFSENRFAVWLSRLLQKIATVREPNAVQLRTARIAMLGLRRAYRTKSPTP